MGCKRFTDPDGAVVFMCTRGRGQQAATRCSCGRVAEYLCDFPLRGEKAGRTCDKPICSDHAKLIKHNTHYCPDHQKDQVE